MLLSSCRLRTVAAPPPLIPPLQTMESGNIGEWRVTEGASFSAGDVICEIETDKATVDFEAQDDGVVAKVLVPSGSTDVAVGSPIMVLVEDEADVPAFAAFTVAAEAAPAAAAEAAPAPPPPPPAAPPAAAPVAAAPVVAAPVAAAASGERVVASPFARKIAREAGLDISAVGGSGPGGRIVADDVTTFLATFDANAAATAAAAPEDVVSAASVATAALPPTGAFADVPVTAAHAEFAAKMTLAKQTVPHYYLNVDVNVEALLEMRATLNESLGEQDALSTNDLLLKAAALALKQVPDLNAAWMDTFVRQFEYVDMAVATASPEGVIYPVLRNVESAGLHDIATASRDLHARSGAGTLGDADLAGGTFTFSNLGAYGVKSASPIVLTPQAAHLAVGAIENRIVPDDSEDAEAIYKEAFMLTAGISCDHRTVDGAVAAQWLAAFRKLVENPITMLL